MITLLAIALYLSVYGACAQSTLPEQVDQSCDTNIRSVWKIVWSCMATTFSCTWVAIHLNVPKQGKGKLWKFGRRASAFAAALIAPEFIIAQAWSQRVSAKEIADKYAGCNWIITHGFFVNMGGFMINIDEEEIEDKSKGDLFTKGFAVLQTTWFILDLIARAVQRLSITELEIATLAFAILNGATYILWLNKPLNVQCPIILTQVQNTTGRDYANGEDSLRQPLIPDQGKHDYPSRVRSISMFASGVRGETNITRDYILVAVGVLFGGIHFIAWFSHFPTVLEKLLWEVACITIVVVPVTLIVLTLTTSKGHFLPDSMSSLPFAVLFVLYTMARLVLFSLTFTTLRSLPPDTYTTVHWSEFVPHI